VGYGVYITLVYARVQLHSLQQLQIPSVSRTDQQASNIITKMKSFVLIAVLAAFVAASPVVPAQICTKICLFEEPDCPGGVCYQLATFDMSVVLMWNRWLSSLV